MEVVRDKADNCIIVCSIENVDPMGVHTGDSHHRGAGADADRQGIPDHAQRLDRGAARDRGGDRRLQRAVRRQSRRRPPRRHRDEPARVALLGAGLQGDGLSRSPRSPPSSPSATRSTSWRTTSPAAPRPPPSSPPSTTSSPRSRASPSRSSPAPSRTLTTSMKSVGEVMAIGRTFAESLQKALRGLETGPHRARRHRASRGWARATTRTSSAPRWASRRPTASSRWRRPCGSASTTSRSTPPAGSIPGSSRASRRSSTWRRACTAHGLPARPSSLRALKAMGFSDARLAKLARLTEAEVRKRRHRARRAAGVQAHRHLRGRVRLAHRLHVLHLRARPGPVGDGQAAGP